MEFNKAINQRAVGCVEPTGLKVLGVVGWVNTLPLIGCSADTGTDEMKLGSIEKDSPPAETGTEGVTTGLMAMGTLGVTDGSMKLGSGALHDFVELLYSVPAGQASHLCSPWLNLGLSAGQFSQSLVMVLKICPAGQ
jgi:hypothetical protein